MMKIGAAAAAAAAADALMDESAGTGVDTGDEHTADGSNFEGEGEEGVAEKRRRNTEAARRSRQRKVMKVSLFKFFFHFFYLFFYFILRMEGFVVCGWVGG
jgi:hypothetical protein